MDIPINDLQIKQIIETIIPSRIVEEIDVRTNRRKSSVDEQSSKRLVLYNVVNVWTNKKNSCLFVKEWCKWACCRAGLKATAIKSVYTYEDQISPTSPKEEKMNTSIDKINSLLKASDTEYVRRKSIIEMSTE